jgi:hypothetical protein
MNIQKIIVSAALIAAAGSALADSRYPVDTPVASTKTRAEVVAELKQAGDQGRLNYANSAYPVLQAASTKTRAEVRAEFAAAEANHELDDIRHNGGN